MRPAESAYWDEVAEQTGHKGGFRDNIWKRQAIMRRLLAHDFIGKCVLEIGVGNGLTMAALNLLILGNMDFRCTDVSDEFCKLVRDRWKFKADHTDVCALPDGPFDIIVALDSLEHVRPEDRQKGFQEIERVLAPAGKVLIHGPLSETQHNLEFDHAFDVCDVEMLRMAVGGRMQKWEEYDCDMPGGVRRYFWAEVVR